MAYTTNGHSLGAPQSFRTISTLYCEEAVVHEVVMVHMVISHLDLV